MTTREEALAAALRGDACGHPPTGVEWEVCSTCADAALYVQPAGVYAGLPDVDAWDEARDARTYDGPHPVVAHPPCARWGRYWYGSPSGTRRFRKGDDGGCFRAALAAVRAWGGVLEHPEGSAAWGTFGLCTPPRSGGWVSAGDGLGWTCCVDQGHFGHLAAKATWLYAVRAQLPILPWGKAQPADPARAKVPRTGGLPGNRGAVHYMTKAERAATPVPFRDLLLAMARSVR